MKKEEINSLIRKIMERLTYSPEWKFKQEMKNFGTKVFEVEYEDKTTGEKVTKKILRDYFNLLATPKGKGFWRILR